MTRDELEREIADLARRCFESRPGAATTLYFLAAAVAMNQENALAKYLLPFNEKLQQHIEREASAQEVRLN